MPPRARKAVNEGDATGKRYPLNMRTTYELRKKLEDASKNSGRSLTQETEYRLERSFEREPNIEEIFGGSEAYSIARIVGLVASHVSENYRGAMKDPTARWTSDSLAYVAGMKAILGALDSLRPHNLDSRLLKSTGDETEVFDATMYVYEHVVEKSMREKFGNNNDVLRETSDQKKD